MIVSSKKPPKPKIDLAYDANKRLITQNKEKLDGLFTGQDFLKASIIRHCIFFFSGIELIELLFTSDMVSFCVKTSE